jgi:threonine dehydratase
MRHGLTVAGRYLVLRSRLPDRPGELIRFLEVVADMRANIVAIEHRREGVALEVADTGIELTVVTRNEQHCLRLIDALETHGYPVERLR